MERKSPSINLLKSNENIVDQVVNWALSIGRVVVILTEIIALGAFLYRFSLDRQLIDLHSKIQNEKSVVNYLKGNEKVYRNLQNRLTLSSTFTKEGSLEIDIFKKVVSFAPQGLTFNNITVQPDRVRMEIVAGSVSSLSDFVKSLKNYSLISSVIIDKIDTRPSAASINASVIGMLKQ